MNQSNSIETLKLCWRGRIKDLNWAAGADDIVAEDCPGTTQEIIAIIESIKLVGLWGEGDDAWCGRCYSDAVAANNVVDDHAVNVPADAPTGTGPAAPTHLNALASSAGREIGG